MPRPMLQALAVFTISTLLSCSREPQRAQGVSIRLPLPPERTVEGPVRFVVVISIDGLRPDAIGSAPAGNLLSMIRRGTSCTEAETIPDSETLPAHASMFTGLEASRHGVTWNDSRPGSIGHPTMFSLASDAGFSTAMLFSKDKFHYFNRPGSVHWIYGPELGGGQFIPAEELASTFSAEWARQRYQLTFVHLGDPDRSGHASGWMSPFYLAAVRRADEAVGVILKTIQSSGRGNHTAVIVTADHGGHDRGHYTAGTRSLENLLIPWICIGPDVPKGGTPDRGVRVQDTAPTALRFLGIRPPAEMEGREVSGVFK